MYDCCCTCNVGKKYSVALLFCSSLWGAVISLIYIPMQAAQPWYEAKDTIYKLNIEYIGHVTDHMYNN